jgi:site-specific DNA-methyltransferase (adenine-specific)
MVEARKDYNAPGRWPTNLMLDEGTASSLNEVTGAQTSRFYPVFAEDAEPIHYSGRATVKERPVVDGVSHSTVKTLSVMRWSIGLVTPPGGLVLDPFAGSGTTGEAARLDGYQSILIEAKEAYHPLIRLRMERSGASHA